MNDLSAIILAGGRGTRLKTLTRDKSKSYVSFLGKYRIIDFPLSSISYSGIKETGIITQYEPYDLMRYIGSGDAWDLHYSGSGISFLTPYEDNNTDLKKQSGTADAVRSQMEFIERSESDYFMILSGDQIYKIDFNDVLKFHKESKADVTIITKEYNGADLNRFGIAEIDGKRRIISFEEKPEYPKSNNISLGMYLFSKDVLIKYLSYADKLPDFGNDLIPYMIKDNANVYSFNHDGIFMDLGTIESLYEGNMFFLDNPDLMDNRNIGFKIYSKPMNYTPLVIDAKGKVKSSIVSDGSIITGSVTHSVIGFSVMIGEESAVTDSVLLPKVKVGKNVKIKNCLINEGTVIKDNLTLEFDEITLIDDDILKEL